MSNINGLLTKMLLVVILVAGIALIASYAFVSKQQTESFNSNIKRIKENHYNAATLLLEQHLQEQILSADEIVMLSSTNYNNIDELNSFFSTVWPRLQLSYSLSSMSFSNGKQNISFGPFPHEKMLALQNSANESKRPQSAIVCHMYCELSATIPVKIAGENWTLSLLTDIAPSIIFLNSVVNSDIGLISPQQALSTENTSLSRYIVEVITGTEKNVDLFEIQMSDKELKNLEHNGIRFDTEHTHYFVWFETIHGSGQDIKLLFIRDISGLLDNQSQQTQQVIVVLITLTSCILLVLILFIIIPISRLNQLKRAIKLIGAKEYNTARFRLGQAKTPFIKDELDELESEFRHAIDVLETYELQLNNSQKRLLRQATIDATTGLYTRNVLIDDLDKMEQNAHIKEVAIFFLDLDGFKPVNDNLGHEAGDIMLKKIGYRLKGVVNKLTKVYRIGGDEFVISYCNYVDKEALLKMADAIVDLFSAPFHIYDTNISISASIGITQQRVEDIDSDQLLRYADIAMYQAKEGGKNRYEFFDNSMRDAAQMRFRIKNDFVSSLADDQLFVVFQPIVSGKSRKVIKLEALCRWQHPDLGYIPPPVFIDVLEESENMNALFDWIIDNVLREIKFLDSIGLDEVSISVNLSSSQLSNHEALTVVKEKTEKYLVNPNRIELEITETSLITNFARAKSWIEDATEFGFHIAIDDFGAGYSSLSYLTALTYNTVKLDRSLLNNIDKDTRQQRVVNSITQMLHSLSVPIVAEGAETEAQYQKLVALGCDSIQGFLISKPIPHHDLVEFLKSDESKHLVKA